MTAEMYPAILGYIEPCTARTIDTNGDPESITEEDADYTWPVVDWCGEPSYIWTTVQGEQYSDGLALTFDSDVTLSDSDMFYIKTSEPLLSMGYMYRTGDESYSVATYDDVCLAGKYLTVDSTNDHIAPGTFLCKQFKGISSAKEIIILRDVDPLAQEAEVVPHIAEAAVIRDMSLPYNPELSTYTVKPVLPSNGSQVYESMAGRKQTVIYSSVVYDISMTFTWSDFDAAERLRIGLEKTLAQGSPILFSPPWYGDNTSGGLADRPVWLLNLNEMPTIQQRDFNVWSVTILGRTQP